MSNAPSNDMRANAKTETAIMMPFLYALATSQTVLGGGSFSTGGPSKGMFSPFWPTPTDAVDDG
jgi:hypothetical protein